MQAFADSPLCERLTRADERHPRGLVRVRARARRLAARWCAASSTSTRRERDGAHLVVDYKTDHVPEDTTPHEYIARNYETQRLVYALAALRAGAPRSRSPTACSSAPTEPVTTIYRAQDAPELADALAQLAHGLLTHHYEVTDTPHRELCGACPGRHALCSHPQSLTLRPPPAPWPGAPARHTSPAGASSA